MLASVIAAVFPACYVLVYSLAYLLFIPENVGDVFLRNVDGLSTDHTA
jgi:hypothetical protein